ncbi:unnamed protein product [Caenorhabditis angaria]|uniref:Cathepsin propeptide inhibitor domain-containing protein n=1 Tax=Caenorhabditis angaria TaxID=860376 RepID=A0A9P1N7H9_9PELO|nr:unnamed protein product [Caenorhabditis angaria]
MFLLFQILVTILFLFSPVNCNYNYTSGQVEAYRNFLNEQSRLVSDLFKNYDPDVSGLYTLRSSNFINQSDYEHPPKNATKLPMQHDETNRCR